MLNYSYGNLFKQPVRFVGIAVNLVGVAGAGQAAEAKALSPGWYAEYRAACQSGELTAGTIHAYYSPLTRVSPGVTINQTWLSIPTKDTWRRRAALALIEASLVALVAWLTETNRWADAVGMAPGSLALPLLGCGLGGLDPALVKPLLASYLDELPNRVTVYAR
jgi:hypothetical protein